MMESLIILANASTQIGTGHLMRCLALAQAWKDANGDVTFITACRGEGLLQRLRDEEFDIKLLSSAYPDTADWNYTRDTMAGHPGAWAVLDGYHFDEIYQRQIKEAGHRLLVIDDMAHLKHYYADIVLNQNLHAEQLRYACEPYTRLLLDTHYVLLRREFLAWKERQREIPEVARRVLVTLGGGDPDNNTLKVIQALQEMAISGLEATVVIGASNPHAGALEQAAKQSRIPIRLVRDAKNMPELMAWADVAVSGGGTTAWELLFMGTPALLLIVADNQRYIVEYIGDQELGKNLGQAGNVSTESLAVAIASLAEDYNLRVTISRKARQIIDGQGAQRVVSLMQEVKKNGGYPLRLNRWDTLTNPSAGRQMAKEPFEASSTDLARLRPLGGYAPQPPLAKDDKETESVLVTGVTGFVGRSLLKSLIRAGYHVIPLVRSPSGLPAEVILDFSDDDFACKIQKIPPVNSIIHLGAKVDWKAKESELFVPNCLATANLVNWAKNIGAYFIFASTATIGGVSNPLITKDTKVNPDTDYAYSKWLAEEIIKMSGVPYLILRISGIYGKNGPQHLGINNAIADALQGKPPTQFGKGDITRNYIYVEDLSRIIVDCLKSEITGTHLVGGLEVLSIAEMLQKICDVFLPGTTPTYKEGGKSFDQIIEHSDQLIQGRRFLEALKDIKAEIDK
jgi:UDP-2,4-diacetamido-2,4,6-trideoxy-beta-L-altropyranose hydrolase